MRTGAKTRAKIAGQRIFVFIPRPKPGNGAIDSR
jgi:hypothetical protein